MEKGPGREKERETDQGRFRGASISLDGDAAKRKVAEGRMHELRSGDEERRRVSLACAGPSTEPGWQSAECREPGQSSCLLPSPISLALPSPLPCPLFLFLARRPDRRATLPPSTVFQVDSGPPTARIGIGWLDSGDGKWFPQRAKAS